MRRAFAIVALAIVSCVGTMPAADAAARRRKIEGQYQGAGGFVFEGSCPVVVAVSSGTYKVKWLARGTYALRMCVTDASVPHVTGTLEVVTRSGATVTCVIDADAPVANEIMRVSATVVGGTKRFANATGTLVLQLTRFAEDDCDPSVPICSSWQERGEIFGTITLQNP